MPPKYYKTGHKEHVAGRMRVIYQKANSQKQYIKKGDNYVAIRKSKLTKGGADIQLNEGNIDAIIVRIGDEDKYFYYTKDDADSNPKIENIVLNRVFLKNRNSINIGINTIEVVGIKDGESSVTDVTDYGEIQKNRNSFDTIIFCLDISDDGKGEREAKYLIVAFAKKNDNFDRGGIVPNKYKELANRIGIETLKNWATNIYNNSIKE